MSEVPANPVEQELRAAIEDHSRLERFLDTLAVGRLWLPLAGDPGAREAGTLDLPTVTYQDLAFVPAYTSAELLSAAAPGAHVVVPVGELAQLLPADLGVALNPGTDWAVPIYPEGIRYLAHAAEAVREAGVERSAEEPTALLEAAAAALSVIPQARAASCAWLEAAGTAGDGLVIGVDLDDTDDAEARRATLEAVEKAVGATRPPFPVEVTFLNAAEATDPFDDWLRDHATPFFTRR